VTRGIRPDAAPSGVVPSFAFAPDHRNTMDREPEKPYDYGRRAIIARPTETTTRPPAAPAHRGMSVNADTDD